MRSSLLPRITSHLVAVLVGGMCYMLIASFSEKVDRPQSTQSTRSKRHTSRTSGVVTENSRRALARMIKTSEENNRSQRDESYRPQSSREQGLEVIADQPEMNRENQAILTRLLALSKNYRSIDNLQPTLVNALIKEDDDATRAIFLEWHRRNPDEAFEIIANHKEWCNWCIDSSVILHLPDDEIITQASRNDRSDDFQESLIYHLGSKLADSDNLKALSKALQIFDDPQREILIDTFVDSWVPDDGAAAARFISEEMTKTGRTLLLQELESGYNPSSGMCGMGIFPRTSQPTLSHHAWTDDFSAALFEYKIDIPDKLLAGLHERASNTDLGIHDTFPIGEPSAPVTLEHGLDPEKVFQHIKGLVADEILHSQDYPELFARGELSAQEIAVAMQQRIEGSDAYPEALARAVYPHLAAHHVSNASTWARKQIAPETLRKDTIELLTSRTGTYQEPRADRIAEWVQVVQPDFPEGSESRHISERFLTHFKKWSVIHPEAAAKATSRIDPEHPIWSHQ